MPEPSHHITNLEGLERIVFSALQAQDHTTLNVIGMGEISIALGWPTDDPQFVCKRTPPFTTAEFVEYRDLIETYVNQLRATGLDVADTNVVSVETDYGVIGYVVQSIIDPTTFGNRVLAASEEDPDHPLLTALVETVELTGPALSIDAQVNNFSWDGSSLTLVDVGTPFLWSDTGELKLNMKPFARMLPAPTRALAKRDLAQVVSRWREPRTVAVDIVANLYREGLATWVDPMLIALNRGLTFAEPITATEAKKHYSDDLKTFPRLVRLRTIERWWQQSVRRQTYQWFVWTTVSSSVDSVESGHH